MISSIGFSNFRNWCENRLRLEFILYWISFFIFLFHRRMFPSLRVALSGLEKDSHYFVVLEMNLVSDCRYKFSGTQWVPAGGAEPQSGQRVFFHPDSPALGSHWQAQPVIFNKVKLTNNTLDSNGHVSILRRCPHKAMMIKNSWLILLVVLSHCIAFDLFFLSFLLLSFTDGSNQHAQIPAKIAYHSHIGTITHAMGAITIIYISWNGIRCRHRLSSKNLVFFALSLSRPIHKSACVSISFSAVPHIHQLIHNRFSSYFFSSSFSSPISSVYVESVIFRSSSIFWWIWIVECARWAQECNRTKSK